MPEKQLKESVETEKYKCAVCGECADGNAICDICWEKTRDPNAHTEEKEEGSK